MKKVHVVFNNGEGREVKTVAVNNEQSIVYAINLVLVEKKIDFSAVIDAYFDVPVVSNDLATFSLIESIKAETKEHTPEYTAAINDLFNKAISLLDHNQIDALRRNNISA